MRRSGSSSHTQFSSICDGASTKSRSTWVPLNMANSACEQSWCITCPNSWKQVSTSPCCSSDGASGVGLVKLATMAAMAICLLPSGRRQPGCRPKQAACPYLPSLG